jgi:hypothetical protein
MKGKKEPAGRPFASGRENESVAKVKRQGSARKPPSGRNRFFGRLMSRLKP